MKLPISTVRLILQKRSEGESFRTIARSLNISKSVIGKILDKASGKHLLNEEVKLDAISDSELQKLFYPTKNKPLIDWADIDEQMQRPRSNLQLLHYRLVTTTPGLEISYSHFCLQYRKWKRLNKSKPIVNNSVTAPGEKLEIDYSGDLLQWVDRSGEINKAHLFVACLPYSSLLFALATKDEKASSWCLGIIKALQYIGGVPRILVVDNAKALVSKASKTEGTVTPVIKDLTEHYGMESWSCQPHRPIQKNRVEASVKIVQTWVQGQLELNSNGPVYASSLEELNEKILKKVNEVNQRPFADKSLQISRQQKFMSEEFAELSPLPAEPYEIAQWRVLTVDKGHCVRIRVDGGHRYSVPAEFTGKAVLVRLSEEEVQIFDKDHNTLLGRHKRCYDLYGQKTHLLLEHMTETERTRRRDPDYFISVLIRHGIDPDLAKKFVSALWVKAGEFLARQRLHAINWNLLRAYKPTLLNEAIAHAVEFGEFKYVYMKERLNYLEELNRRQSTLELGAVDESYKTPVHSNIRNNYE